MDGTSCNISPIGDTHDHGLIIEESASNDLDDNKQGVLRADFSQPPTKKTKKGKKMKNKKAKVDDVDEDEEEIEEDMIEEDVADGENKIMKGGEKKYPKGVVDGDDPEVEEKIKGSPYGTPSAQKIGAKDMIEINAVKDMIAEATKEALADAMKPYKEAEDAKEAHDLREILIKEPYNFKEDYLKDKSLMRLKEIKEDFEQTKAYKDFVENAEDLGIGDVNKSLFDEGAPQKSMMADFIESSQKKYWGWADPQTKKDFFSEGV